MKESPERQFAFAFYQKALRHFMIGDALKHADISDYRLYDIDNIYVALDDLDDLVRVYGYKKKDVLILLPWLMTCQPFALWPEGCSRANIQQIHEQSKPFHKGPSVRYQSVTIEDFKEFRLSQTWYVDPTNPEEQDEFRFYTPGDMEDIWDDVVEFARAEGHSLHDVMPLFAHLAQSSPLELFRKALIQLPRLPKFSFGDKRIKGHLKAIQDGCFAFIAADYI